MRSFYLLVFYVVRPIFFLIFPYKIIGRGDNIPQDAAIICANHSSFNDALYAAFALGSQHHLRFMAKIELSRIPILGWILAKIGVFFVDRGNADSSAIRTMMKILKEGGKVMMFPQGTRVSEDEGAAAKTGAVRLASKLSVPILPVYIPVNKKPFRRTTVVIGEPYIIDRTLKEDSDVLSAELMDRIASLKAVTQ